MGTKHIALSALLAAATFSLSSGAFAAGTLTGQIGVQLTISAGCTVGNGSVTAGVNQWGNINFGNYSDLTNVVNGTLIGANGTSAVTVTCSTGLTPTLSLNAGNNGGTGVRAMTAGGATTIPYRLYSNTARTTEIGINTPIALAIGAQDFPIYARVLPADQTTTAPAAATYNDTVVATIAW
ncbi:spore coat protein U domain-containing protein [Rouxiella sp. T17]|uniref:Csu type fimbrial protein n=1 Tax=Rouxiella sp. T17 TaxID=3085684 RepID=UPI002FC76C29